jgi:MFS family permease
VFNLKKQSSYNLVFFCNFLELFDLYLYVHLSSVLHKHLFPWLDDSFLKYFSMAGLYLIAPLASLWWAKRGDTYGRRSVLLLSSVVTGIVTTMIAFIPDHTCWAENQKYYPLVILVILRIIQGIALAGEPSAAKLYSVESYINKDKDMFFKDTEQWNERFLPIAVTKMTMGEGFGGTLALGLMFFSSNFLADYSWGWRFPFVFAAFASIFVMIIRNFLFETEDFRKYTKKITITPLESYSKRLMNAAKINKKKGLIFLVLSMGYPVLFAFNFTFFSPLIIKQLGYEKDFIYFHNFYIVLAHLFLEYLMAYVPCKLGWHKYRTMAVYHIIAAIGVAALIYGSLTQDWPIWIYIVIQTITMLGITWNLIYGYVLKKFPIEDRFKLMAAYGGSARMLSYIFFIVIFPLFWNFQNVTHYGILCIAMILASMYAAKKFTQSN